MINLSHLNLHNQKIIMTFQPFTNFTFFLRTATARGKAEQSDIASMHARDDAQIAKESSLEYGATTASPTSPSNEANDVSKATLSPTKQLGSAREYFQWTMNIPTILF